jgi:lipocalin
VVCSQTRTKEEKAIALDCPHFNMTCKTHFFAVLVTLASHGATIGVHAAEAGTRGLICETVEPLDPFDLEAYASARWYVHEQSKTFYSSPGQTCVRADYTVLDDPTSPWKYTVGVNNQLGKDENNNEGDTFLCAYQVKAGTAQLAVAPCFTPRFVAGAYWVVAYDEDEGYALVSGGQPKLPAEDGCRTGSTYYNSGLFILLRSPVRDEALIETVKDIASDLGIDTGALFSVDHTDCDYA